MLKLQQFTFSDDNEHNVSKVSQPSFNLALISCFLFCVSLQVLAIVKNQIEEQAATRTDFPELITAAQHWLLVRETSGDNTPTSGMLPTLAGIRCLA